MSILRHIRLVVVQLAKAPISTFVLLALAGALAAINLQSRYDLSVSEVTRSMAAVVVAILFLKAALMFFAFRFFNNQRFDGSFATVAILIALLLILALLLGASVAGPRIDGFPSEELPIVLLGLYALVVIFLYGAFHLSHWFFGLLDRKGSNVG